MPVALLGIPHDENSSYLRGAAEAPARIRRELRSDAYNLWTETGIDLGVNGILLDEGDVPFNQNHDAWSVIEQRVRAVSLLQCPMIFLGGDHAITHPILRGMHPRHPKLTILHFDAHCDLYEDYEGNPRSHASPFARIMEEGLADRLIQVGIRTATDHHRDQIKRYGVELIEAKDWHAALRIDWDAPVYISMNIDCIDPAYVPGVSHREPGGPSPRDVINLIHSITQPVIAADLVEYNPSRDVSDLTAGVAAKLTKEIAGVMLRNAMKMPFPTQLARPEAYRP